METLTDKEAEIIVMCIRANIVLVEEGPIQFINKSAILKTLETIIKKLTGGTR